jgi:hypothetical protein
MKALIALLLLVPTLTFAQGREYISETERTTIINNGLVSSQVSTYRKEGTREWYDDCEMREWNTPWGKGTELRCNWTERQAMETALTHAPDGLKVEWYDQAKNAKGYTVVSWTRPLSDQGWCRDIEMVRFKSNSLNKNTYIMCFTNGRGWQSFRGH